MTALTLRTDDGLRLAARWREPPGGAARPEAVVVVHGFCGSQDMPEVGLVAARQVAAGRRVLTFDLRGHGRSEGVTTMGVSERLDVDAAVRAARADHDVVVVVGASMGGVATIDHLATPADDDADSVSDAGLPHADGRAPADALSGPLPPDGRAPADAASGSRHPHARAPAHAASGSRPPGGRAPADAASGSRHPHARAPADGAVVVGTPAHWRVPRSARGVLAMALTQTPPGRAVAARRMGTRVAPRVERGRSPVERVAAVVRPLAVVHGLADRFVSPRDAHDLRRAVRGPARLDLVPGMGHAFCAPAVDPIDEAVAWVLDVLAGHRRDAAGDGRAS